MNPMIFISAVSGELGQSRQLVANVLSRLGYTAVIQEIFGTEGGDLRDVLRRKIDRCDGLIQIVGAGYGFEPPTVDPQFGRISYTQFEYLYAVSKGLKTWVIEVEGAFPRDRKMEELDRPSDSVETPNEWQRERRELQAKYLARVKSSGHLWHTVASRVELELRIERLKDELGKLRENFEQWKADLSGEVHDVPDAVARRLSPWPFVRRHKWMLAAAAILIGLLAASGLVWRSAQQRAEAAVAAAAEDAERTWDQVQLIDRGQTVGNQLEAAEAKMRSARERSNQGDHVAAADEFRQARDLARAVIDADRLRREAKAAAAAYEDSRNRTAAAFGAATAADAAAKFEAGDFSAAAAQWATARGQCEAGAAKQHLDQELRRYDVRQLEPLTPKPWAAFRAAEAKAVAAEQAGDYSAAKTRFIEAKKLLDAATEPARCREAFVIGYVFTSFCLNDRAIVESKARNMPYNGNGWPRTVERILYSDDMADFFSDDRWRWLNVPQKFLVAANQASLTSEGVGNREMAVNALLVEVDRVNGEAVGKWCWFGRQLARVRHTTVCRTWRRHDPFLLPPFDEAVKSIQTTRRLADETQVPAPIPALLDDVLAIHQSRKGQPHEWGLEAFQKLRDIEQSLCDNVPNAVRMIANKEKTRSK